MSRNLTLRKTQEGDLFVGKVHPGTLESLFQGDVVDGDYILLKGKKRTETVLRVIVDENIPEDVLVVKDMVALNVLANEGETVSVQSCHEIKMGKVVVVQVNQGTPTDSKKLIKAFFGRRDQVPVCKNNLIPMGNGTIMKILTCDPVVYCLINQDTEIQLKEGHFSVSKEMERMNYLGYDNIGGCRRQLEQIKEMIDLPLRHPELFTSVGVSPPRGILLYGPPGTGKTMIARAVANETGAFFFFINGPEVMSKMAGEAEANIRKIFKEAERNAPAIIFIDEIDSLAPRRDKSNGEVEKRIVSQMLTMMDGIKPRASVIIVGATNRPNTLDPALRRYGRFDREINVGVPDLEGRLEILKIHSRRLRISPEVNLLRIAERTHGFVGADLAQVCTEAAMQCIRERSGQIDFERDKNLEEDELQRFVVTPVHFERALMGAKPASLREAMVEIPKVGWDEVGGLGEVKSRLHEMVQMPMDNPELYSDFGLKPPRGVLFYGPPGCGKTLIAKAIASQCGANFVSVKGPELLTMWFGESESNVRDLFERARQAAPCILFFDEIDSIAKARGGGFGMSDSASSASDRVINQLLTEMDGIGSSKQVFVIGATNRPEILDPAIMRPGRLDQLIYIPVPDKASRVAILKTATKKMPLAHNINMDFLAEITDGFSGADLAEVCQAATRQAMRDFLEGRIPEKRVSSQHFENVIYESRRSVTAEDIRRYEIFQQRLTNRR